MELREVLKTGKALAEEAVSVAKEKELREKAVTIGTTIAKKTAHAVISVSKDVVQKTEEYVEENHIGSKGKYIAQLEARLEEKDKEIRVLKKKLAKRTWKK